MPQSRCAGPVSCRGWFSAGNRTKTPSGSLLLARGPDARNPDDQARRERNGCEPLESRRGKDVQGGPAHDDGLARQPQGFFKDLLVPAEEQLQARHASPPKVRPRAPGIRSPQGVEVRFGFLFELECPSG